MSLLSSRPCPGVLRSLEVKVPEKIGVFVARRMNPTEHMSQGFDGELKGNVEGGKIRVFVARRTNPTEHMSQRFD